MSSLVERLRIRSDRRPSYNIDESDDEADFEQRSGRTQEKPERYVRSDAKADSCQGCGENGDLLECETCTYAYHSKCLLPPLRSPPNSWKCPECLSPLNDIDKILDCEMRPTVAEESDASKLGSKQIFVKQYLVKWKGLSYLHCTWVPEKEFLKAFKAHPGLRTKVNNFNNKSTTANNSEDDFVAIRPEWTTVDRILASSKQKNAIRDAKEAKKKPKEFQHYERSPDFLTGGSLHPYQLEGLNFLRFSWSKQTHVILADEMGLGKTIQSIAFLGSLFEENLYPHLVVAPLSTLRNWEREFATWAPHINVVMYVGSSAARSVIREYEFYFPKGQSKKLKKKKAGQVSSESKQDRIKFDVLLTSYEMINLDSASLKPIKWECVIVDEGHRLKNKDSKLFISLKQYSSNHRTLLTGTPLQNNLDELFMLMHFLDAGKFSSLEEFQEEFKDINQEEQIARLHKMLAPHLLRRVKKDVLKEMPPKKELILRVELSSKQKEYYKAILTRNYEILTRKGGGHISLINVVMELRKLCCHAYMLDGVEPDIEDPNEAYRQLLDTSGKLHLLDKMMVKLKGQGHRVLIYTQFQHMLDLLEDYCIYKKWLYERIDGKVSGAERQVRIDRFNANNSSRFCFLLSTRAGGLGINLATADTVIIYDSDWNPHADLQAMARAHRLGQTNKVMIYRLITRGTIEERMMQLTKKKMVLEHLVVGKLKAQNINQEELDDIIRYGSKELFADESDEAGKARQIHYDDAAIDRLLDRDQAGAEEATVDDVVDDGGFLKAFKVANFEYIDEVQAAAEAEAQKASMLNKPAASNTETKVYWEDLLKDRYEEHKMVSVEEDDLAGLEDASSDEEFDVTEADWVDAEMISAGTAAGKRPQSKKKARADASGPIPLMEGEGNSFRVLGFNQSQRAAFVQILMRFGVGDYDWVEFAPRLKQKAYEEIKEYGTLFLSHITEEINDAPCFSDGVPKEGLRIQDVLVRIAVLMLIKEKASSYIIVQLQQEQPGNPLFAENIISRYPGLKSGKSWREEHDLLLLHAVLKHGYGRWQNIVDDKDLHLQEIICQEQNLPFINTSSSGASQMNAGVNPVNPEMTSNKQSIGSGGVNDFKSDFALGTTENANRAQVFQDPSMLYNFREMQRRLVEFIKKRVLLLEKGLNAEYQKVYFGDDQPNEVSNGAPNVVDVESPTSLNNEAQTGEPLPAIEPIALEELKAVACDDCSDRINMGRLYNELCKVVGEYQESVQLQDGNKPAGFTLKESISRIEAIKEDLQHVFTPPNTTPSSEDIKVVSDQLAQDTVSGGECLTRRDGDDSKVGEKLDSLPKVSEADSEPPSALLNSAKDSSEVAESNDSSIPVSSSAEVSVDVDMADTEPKRSGVIVLDD
ncbi:hypothetical protein MKW92_048806 [Papaver armeniacum]|nr:hypothetical protein MKW92_048806 [Papaver armeniacum]